MKGSYGWGHTKCANILKGHDVRKTENYVKGGTKGKECAQKVMSPSLSASLEQTQWDPVTERERPKEFLVLGLYIIKLKYKYKLASHLSWLLK